jgi:hypothetical protein
MSLIFVRIFRDVNYFFIPGTQILHLSFTTQHTLIKQPSGYGICVLSLNLSLDIYFWTSDGYIRAPPYSNFSRVRNLTPKFSIIFDNNEQNYDLMLFVFSWKNFWLTWNISKSKNKWILIMLEISDYLRGRYGIYRDLCKSIMYVLP